MTEERFSISGQVNAGGFYPYYVELEMENRLHNRLRVFGTKEFGQGSSC